MSLTIPASIENKITVYEQLRAEQTALETQQHALEARLEVVKEDITKEFKALREPKVFWLYWVASLTNLGVLLSLILGMMSAAGRDENLVFCLLMMLLLIQVFFSPWCTPRITFVEWGAKMQLRSGMFSLYDYYRYRSITTNSTSTQEGAT